MKMEIYSTKYVVTVYSHEPLNIPKHKERMFKELAMHMEGFGGDGKIKGFDVAVDFAVSRQLCNEDLLNPRTTREES
jgi:hypothetical protein